MIGKQEVKQLLPGGIARAFFTTHTPYGKLININVSAVVIDASNSFNSLEDLLNTIPVEQNTTVERLIRDVATSFGGIVGTDHPEHRVVCHSHSSPMYNPIAEVTMPDGSIVFVKHPQINLMLFRY